ncbi:peptidase A4 family-domain-containing protein [Xylariaceae sp. FL1019]|nr:peptidase A4 family-domain-containing protein [Xylariaceae sp. FL1019]
MKLFPVANVLLCASSSLAAPGTAARRQRALESRLRRTNPALPVPVDNASNIQNVDSEYTQNWAGAVLLGTGYTTVSGTIVVPEPAIPAGGSTSRSYAAAAWVGIDGSTCQSAILQTGVDFIMQNGVGSYEGWYEWYSDYSYTFTGFKISAGDTIAMSVTTTSKNSGSVTLDNKTTGKSVSHTFANQEGDLCQTNAEWIVEDFLQGNSLVPLVDFATVTFTNATVNGKADLSGATIYDIKQGNTVYTACSAVDSTSVTCAYTG